MMKIREFFLFFLLLFSSFYFLTANAHAVEVAQIEPAKVRVIVPPGGAQTGTVKIDNPSTETKKIRVYIEDWSYLPACDGTKEFKPPSTTKLSAAEWINFSPSEFKLPPFSRQALNYTVRIPESAKGGRYAVLFFESILGDEKKGPSEGVNVNIAVRVASLFYVEPKGTITRQAKISNLKVDRVNEEFIVSLDFANTGNVDITTEANFSIIDKKGVVYARGKFNNVYSFPDDRAVMVSKTKESMPAGVYDLIVTADIGKALEEVNLGRGPVITKEAQVEIGDNGQVVRVGSLN